MTHARCVEYSCELARRLGFKLILPEFKAATRYGEIADVIAFRGGGETLVIECKVSRADLLADKEKVFREVPGLGMGLYRMYVMPEGIIKYNDRTDIPEGWHVTVLREDGYPAWSSIHAFGNMALPSVNVNQKIAESFWDRNTEGEVAVLYSYIQKSKMLNEKTFKLTHKDETWRKKEAMK